MTDLYTLLAKIKTLPKKRVAEVDDFVDFLILRRPKPAKPPLPFQEKMAAIDKAVKGHEHRPSA